MKGHAGLRLSARKARDRSIALLLFGIVFLMPPLVGIARSEGTIGGVPATLVYAFAVWILLIVGAKVLSRPLRRAEQSDGERGVDGGNG